jgi:hypothetical protein
MNADSDGDSVSRFLVGHKGTQYIQYQKARENIVNSLANQTFDSDIAREREIRNRMIGGGMDASVYDAFRGLDINMAQSAFNENATWNARVLDTIEGDFTKTLAAQTIRNGKGSTVAEVVGGTSILGKQKLPSLNVDPTLQQVSQSITDASSILKAVQDNAQYLDADKYKSILQGSSNILDYDKEAETLDTALTAIQDLVSNKNLPDFDKNYLASMENIAKRRIRINNYQGELMSKLGITATGNVNATLFGISQAVKNYYGLEGMPYSDEVKTQIWTNMAYEMEQSPISSKKATIKAGDDRLVNFTDLFKQAKQDGTLGDRTKSDSTYSSMKNWLYKYMDHGKILNQYENSLNRAGLQAFDLTTDAGKDAAVNYMIDESLNVIESAFDKHGPMRKMVDAYSGIGRRSANPYIIESLRGLMPTDSSFTGQLVGDITGIEKSSARLKSNLSSTAPVSNAVKETIAETVENMKSSSKVANIGSSVMRNINLNANSVGAAMAMGVVGLASGLIAAGYASGNPLNDANPETVAQEQVRPAGLNLGNDQPVMAPNNTRGYIINVRGDTAKGNRQLKRAMKQAANNSVGGGVSINMNLRTSNEGGYTDKDIENILSNYF